MSSGRPNCLTYYMHDQAAAFRVQLAGDLSKDSTADLEQARETASSVFGGRPLIVDCTGIQSMDAAGRELIEGWHDRDAQFVVTTLRAKTRMESMAGVPFGVLRESRDRSEWLPGRLVAWLLAAMCAFSFGAALVTARHGFESGLTGSGSSKNARSTRAASIQQRIPKTSLKTMREFIGHA